MFQSVESPNTKYIVLPLCSLSAEEKRYNPARCPCFCLQKCTFRAMASSFSIPVRNEKMCRYVLIISSLLIFLIKNIAYFLLK